MSVRWVEVGGKWFGILPSLDTKLCIVIQREADNEKWWTVRFNADVLPQRFAMLSVAQMAGESLAKAVLKRVLDALRKEDAA